MVIEMLIYPLKMVISTVMLVYQRVLFANAVGVYTHAKGNGSIVTCIEVDLNKSNSRP